MRKQCGLANCQNAITQNEPGGKVGYTIGDKQKEVHCCQSCTYKIMTAPRGTWHIDEKVRLRPIPARPTIIT